MSNTDTLPLRKRLQFFNLDASDSLEKPQETEISGAVPKWLNGSLFRNGPGVFHMGETYWKHLFDGDGVLQRWTISDGRVTFLCKILDTEQWKKSLNCERMVGDSFATKFPDPCKSIFARFFSKFSREDHSDSENANVNVMEFGDKLFAMTETTNIVEVDPEKLKINDTTNISKLVAVHMGTAHPHFDVDGTLYYYGTRFDPKTAYNIVKIPPPAPGEATFSNASILAAVPSRWKSNIAYTHSFGMSENYIVLLENSVCMSLFSLSMMQVTGNTFEQCNFAYQDEPIQIHVIDKKTGKKLPITFKALGGFVFHFINCYEEDGHLVCDVCFYPEADVFKLLYVDALCAARENKGRKLKAMFRRYVLPLEVTDDSNLVKLPNTTATAKLRKEQKTPTVDLTPENPFGSTSFELPRINYTYNAKKYRYFYGTTVLDHTTRKLYKFDLLSKTYKEWQCEENHIPGEPVFVANPDAKEEDEGIVIATILADTTEFSSFLLILDASSFKEIARASLPPHVKMNLTFHGDYMAGRVYNNGKL